MFRTVLPGLAACCTILCAAGVNYVPLSPEVLMPDGTPFRTWADETRYTKTYHVNQNHPRAGDGNPGTEELPFRTIGAAARVLKPGERVWIHSGVYREMVEPAASGEGPDRMIAYEAAPGEQAVIRGSRVLPGGWERSRDPHGKSRFSQKLWMLALPDTLFDGGYNPFQTPNASDAEMDLMPWALQWKGRIPYTLPRGLLFQDGRRMAQLATYEDLVRVPGSYWVAPGGKAVHIHPFGGGDPNGAVFEAAVQPHLFKPRNPGTGFIRVSGLILEHCANGLPRIGIGALFTNGGHHWIVERNTVRHANSVGIEFGYDIFERADKRYVRRPEPDLGHTIVRNNRIYDCGTAGIRSHTVSYALVEGNEITGCGWQDAEYHWEMAGIKLLINRGTLVRNNHIGRIESACGIWLDWDNRNSRVTGNFIHDISTVQAAVFVEASQQPNMIDNNVFWNIDGQGVRAADTDELTVAHNLFANVKEDLVFAKVATNRSLGGRRLTSKNNRVVNNVFLNAARPIVSGDDTNVVDFNTYVTTSGKSPAVQPGIAEKHSTTLTADMEVTSDMLLVWKMAQQLPEVPVAAGCERDYAGVRRQGTQTTPGPFIGLAHGGTFRLQRTP